MKTNLKFRIKYKFTLPGEEQQSGVETEASWFLLTQQGELLSHGPMRPIKPVTGYDECIPLIMIGGEWLSVEEIEKRIKS